MVLPWASWWVYPVADWSAAAVTVGTSPALTSTQLIWTMALSVWLLPVWPGSSPIEKALATWPPVSRIATVGGPGMCCSPGVGPVGAKCTELSAMPTTWTTGVAVGPFGSTMGVND